MDIDNKSEVNIQNNNNTNLYFKEHNNNLINIDNFKPLVNNYEKNNNVPSPNLNSNVKENPFVNNMEVKNNFPVVDSSINNQNQHKNQFQLNNNYNNDFINLSNNVNNYNNNFMNDPIKKNHNPFSQNFEAAQEVVILFLNFIFN